MNSTDNSNDLLKLSKQLVTAAEQRGELKAEFSHLARLGKTNRSAAKRAKLEQQMQRLSQKIDGLLAAVAEPLPRRAERWAGVMPVSLLVERGGRKFEQIASTVDLSDLGMRIRTTTALSQGQTLEVFCWGKRVGCCRVVWVSAAGSDRPGEVGLQILY